MTGTTPLLGIAYPEGTDPPAGMTEMEVIVRALEKYGVLVAANATARDDLITAGLRHEGQLVYLTTPDTLQVRKDTSWKDVWTDGDIPVRRGNSLPSASDTPGLIFVRTTDDAVWFSTGSQWVRLIDSTDTRSANGNRAADTVTTQSTNGTDNPASGPGVSCNAVVPDSGFLIVTVSALAKIDNANLSQAAIFGWEVRNANGGSLVDYSDQRAARTPNATFSSISWTSLVNVGQNHAGDSVHVVGMHAVTSGARTATYTMREVVAVPVR